MNETSGGTDQRTSLTEANGTTVDTPGGLGTASGKGEVIAAKEIQKAYSLGRKRVEVLRGVDLVVNPGEFVALRGASGAGKSTLLHILGGLDTPTGGIICYGQRKLSDHSATELSRFRNEKVGFVFQSYHILPELTALENVCLPARIARESMQTAEPRARALLERVGLGGRMDHKPLELSGGEQQRVAVARALINSPELILADEPTGNLDSHTGQEIIDLLLSLRSERNATLIIATHDTAIAARAPRMVELVDGRIE
jgi:lipoprotein-releasing system ATP-binding protein